MGLFDKLRQELIDIIEWKDETRDTIVWRFPRYQSEIKNGAQLTVRESQVAVLVDEGKFADVFQPGRHELTTANIPILSTIRGWKYGFNSPFKVDVYFVNTKEFLNMRWGTTNPVTVSDPQLHRAINLRAYGSYNFRVSGDPTVFLRKVAGTNGTFDTEAISEMLRTFAVTEFSDYLGEHEIPVVKMASNYKEFSAELTEALKESFSDYGLELTKFLVENISLPPEVQAAIDKGASMAFIGAENMNTYTQMQFANSMEKGADTPNSGAGAATGAMGMGMGFGMGGAFGAQMGNIAGSMQVPPPPMPNAVMFHVYLNGAQMGPYNIQQIQQLIQTGQVARDTLVWTNGMPQWAPAVTCPQLMNLFGATPPPMPPTPPMP